MLVIIVQAAIPVREIDDRTNVQVFLIWLFLGDFKFHFGSVFRIMKLEYEIFK
jgi:hypothetical protein